MTDKCKICGEDLVDNISCLVCENDELCKIIEKELELDITSPTLKYFAVIRYIQNKNIDHGYFTEKNNCFYIYYLAGFKHMIDYMCGDLLRRNIFILSESDHKQFKEEFFKAYDMLQQIDKKLLFSGHLSTSDKLSLDFACEFVDGFTYNFD